MKTKFFPKGVQGDYVKLTNGITWHTDPLVSINE